MGRRTFRVAALVAAAAIGLGGSSAFAAQPGTAGFKGLPGITGIKRAAPGLMGAKGKLTAFVEVKADSGLDQKVRARRQLDMTRSSLSEEQKDAQASSEGRDRAQEAKRMADKAFKDLKAIDPQASLLYDVSYSLSGAVVTADASALRKLYEHSDLVTHVVPVRAVKALDDEKGKTGPGRKGDGIAPANTHNDQLVDAVKTWNETHKTGKGQNIAIVDTGLDYTHADFGGKGTEAAYRTALGSRANPLTDPTLKTLLDASKYKGGYDFAGADYGSDNAHRVPVPDENPIDGEGGHHGTHVAGTAAGYGVSADGTRFSGDYTGLTQAQVTGMRVGPGSAPEAGIYALKVFGDKGGTTNLTLQALDWVAKHNMEDTANKIGIVSMSLGSSFGAVDDPINRAVDALSKDDVLSVIAAGNEGDVTDIAGSPGSAPTALTVAASQSGKAFQDAALVAAGPASLLNQKIAGQYSVSYTAPISVTGKVVRVKAADNLNGCKPYSDDDKAAVNGNIAYVDWNDDDVACGSAKRFDNAAAAGAKAIVFPSQSNIPEAEIAGNESIPGFQIFKKAATDADFRSAIDAGTLQLTLSDNLRMSVDADYSSEYEDTVASFTSRGIHGSYDGTAKPDVSAPGVNIISASAGSGNGSESMNGTSMATPLTSGVAALVRQAHPGWNAYRVKTQMVNTADHDVLTAGSSTAYGPLRVGTGRIDAFAAVNNTVGVSSSDDGTVTGQFGIVQVPQAGYKADRTFTVTNDSDKSKTYRLSYAPRTSTPGVSYSLDKDTVTVAAHSTAQFKVTLNIPDQSKLRHIRDVTQSVEVAGKNRSYVSDSTGVVKLTPTQQEDGAFGLRVALTAAPKPVSQTSSLYEETVSGNRHLTMKGHGIGSEREATSYTSQAIPMVLGVEDPVDGYYGDPNVDAQRSLAAADIRSVAYASTAPQMADPSKGMLYFGIVTDKSWSHLGNGNVDPAVYLDTDGDGVPNYAITVLTEMKGAQFDTVLAVTYKIDGNGWSIADLEPIDDAFISDSNQVILSASLSAMGYKKGSTNTRITYQVETMSSNAAGAAEQYVADSAGDIRQDGFDAYNPPVWFGEKKDGKPAGAYFDDREGSVIPVNQAVTRSSGADKIITLHTRGQVPEQASDQLKTDVSTLVVIDKARLQAAVDQYSKLNAKSYTKASWDALQSALTAARAVLSNPDAVQRDIDMAYQNLQTAYQGLVPASAKVSKDKLKAAVEVAKSLKQSDYTKASWDPYAAALSKAEQVLANPNATQEEVNKAEQALQTARAGLVRVTTASTSKPKKGKKGKKKAAADPGDKLSRTGADVGVSLMAALALALAGGILVVRRRERSSES